MITGKLDKLVSIYTPTEAVAATGQVTKTWTKLIDLFANLEHKPGNETYQADQKVSVTSQVFTIYNKVATITTQMLVKYNSQYYEILSVTPDRTEFYLMLNCQLRDNQNIGL